jgi:beta-galactosidase/beta-glucuronidase
VFTGRKGLAGLAMGLGLLAAASAQSTALPARIELTTGWQLQDSAKVTETSAEISAKGYPATGWLAATVPGTVLTSLVRDGVYPEPTYGENNRPSVIPETLNKTPWWYRTTVTIPAGFAHRQVWLHFDGANYSSDVWVNGTQVGTFTGAFIRGRFDISKLVKPGEAATIAVKVSPQPHPGVPHEHNIANGLGPNGGITAIDGPTFLSTIGWDWLNAVRDRDTGIWQKVWLSANGPVLVEDPLVITDLPLPKTDTADITVKATLNNSSDKEVKGTLEGDIVEGPIGTANGTNAAHFSQKVTLAASKTEDVTIDPKTTATLHLANPRLWWPNGYGPQKLYHLRLRFIVGGK